MYHNIHFWFLKTSNKQQEKTRTKKSKRNQRRKENISGKSIKKKIAAVRVKIFFVNHISGNKSVIFFGLISYHLVRHREISSDWLFIILFRYRDCLFLTLVDEIFEIFEMKKLKTCMIWWHLYKIKNVTTTMKEWYF